MKSTTAHVPQASVVPYRFRGDRLEICLITSRRSGRWGFPKGTVDALESPASCALREAFEEAGLTGSIIDEPIAEYSYTKRGRICVVSVMLMDVSDTASTWMEASQRERTWATLEDARRRIDKPHLRVLLDAAADRIRIPAIV